MYTEDDDDDSSGEHKTSSGEFIELKQFDTSRDPPKQHQYADLNTKNMSFYELEERCLHYKRTSE